MKKQPYKKIALVDDHVVVRNGLKELIELMGTYQVSNQFDNGSELIAALPFRSPPDLIIVDLNMPVMNGVETMKHLSAAGVDIPVLILTLNTADATIIELFRLGVRGYLEKDCTAQSLQKAIEGIFKTGYHHNDLLAKALIAENKPVPKDEREEILKQITPRELEFLRLVCDANEYTYEQMRHEMGVSLRTVDGYREALFEKFSLKSKTGLVLFAIKHKLV